VTLISCISSICLWYGSILCCYWRWFDKYTIYSIGTIRYDSVYLTCSKKITEMSWQVNEEVSRDMTGEADGKNPGVDSTDGWLVMFNTVLSCSDVYFVCRNQTLAVCEMHVRQRSCTSASRMSWRSPRLANLLTLKRTNSRTWSMQSALQLCRQLLQPDRTRRCVQFLWFCCLIVPLAQGSLCDADLLLC